MVYLTILGGLGQTLFPPLLADMLISETAGLAYVVANPTQIIIIVVILYETQPRTQRINLAINYLYSTMALPSCHK
jgi:hypothetical protein